MEWGGMRLAVFLINVLYFFEDALVSCRLRKYIKRLASGGFALRPPPGHRGSALGPGPRLGLLQAPVPTLPPNPGYATETVYLSQYRTKIET